jgi:hypothetical protein
MKNAWKDIKAIETKWFLAMDMQAIVDTLVSLHLL